MNQVILYDSTGQEINMPGLGLVGLRLTIPAPTYRTTKEELDGQAGEIILDRVLNPRYLSAEFFVKAENYEDSVTTRNLLYSIFGHGDEFYVSENVHPSIRWKVYAEGWTPERINRRVQTLEMPLIAISGTAESINLSNQKFTTTVFRFNNEGNVLIDPRVHKETELEFRGESTNLLIRNNTTGDEWSWSGETTANDILTIKGSRSLKNNVSVFGQTNKKLITFQPGWNDFEILNTSGAFEVIIRTRFYFL